MDVAKNRSVFKNTTECNKFAEALGICTSKFRVDRKNGFGLGGEIEGVLCLEITKPMHPVPVIEKDFFTAGPVDHDALEESIQTCRKRWIIFVKVHQIGSISR